MPNDTEIEAQLRLLERHRDTLAVLISQLATLGRAYAPPYVFHGIDEARADIRRVKQILRGWGVVVDDHPDDEPAPSDGYLRTAPRPPSKPITPPVSTGSPKEPTKFSRVADTAHEPLGAMAGCLRLTLEPSDAGWRLLVENRCAEAISALNVVLRPSALVRIPQTQMQFDSIGAYGAATRPLRLSGDPEQLLFGYSYIDQHGATVRESGILIRDFHGKG